MYVFSSPRPSTPVAAKWKNTSSACAVIVVDMQYDYCSPGYYIDQAGYDTQRLSEPIERVQSVLPVACQSGLHVIYTRHGRLLDSDQSNIKNEQQTLAAPPFREWPHEENPDCRSYRR